MRRLINPNFREIVKAYNQGAAGVVLEGSSRSGKTWSIIDSLPYFSARKFKNEKIVITRDTYTSFKTTLYDDFNRRLPDFGIRSPFLDTKNVTEFQILDNKIHLIGSDDHDRLEGAGSWLFWMNEVLDQPNMAFDQLEQRCRKFFILDYNPKRTEHWVYEKVCKRSDVVFFHSTFLDNPYISVNERNKILSYEPTPTNIAQGTADDFRWKVYGLGVRTAHEGVIIKNWKIYKELPECDLYKLWVIDWGGNDPTTLTEMHIDGDLNRLYLKEHIYQPNILNSKLIDYILKVNPENSFVICDSARRDKKFELEMAGISVLGSTKGEGSKIDGLERLMEFEIFLHEDSKNAINEFSNHKWAVDKSTGKSLNEPEDKDDHIFDPVTYGLRFYRRSIRPL